MRVLVASISILVSSGVDALSSRVGFWEGTVVWMRLEDIRGLLLAQGQVGSSLSALRLLFRKDKGPKFFSLDAFFRLL